MTSPEPCQAVLPDMPDTRLLVELTSHASDLSEASHSLAHAIAAGESSPLWLPLTSHAVTAYIRPFIHSKVRRRLDEMLDVAAVPSSMKPLHEVIPAVPQHNYRPFAIELGAAPPNSCAG